MSTLLDALKGLLESDYSRRADGAYWKTELTRIIAEHERSGGRKSSDDGFYKLLDAYFDALVREPKVHRQTQIDKARLAIIYAYENGMKPLPKGPQP